MYALCRDNERRVFNLTSGSEFKITWGEIIETGCKIVRDEVPFNGVVWYPGGSMKKSRLLHNICVILFHMLPAYLIDALILLSGNKPV
jgi:fatty acyl-CoA reductase